MSLKIAASLACLVALPCSILLAKDEPPKRELVLKPIKFIEYDLPNGLHVILHENHAAPVVSTYVLYHVGSKNERPDRTGFAHFFEHLMFEGTDNIPRGTIDKFISGAGGNLNASTSFDQTDYYFNLPTNQLKLALWIESERMMHAKIDEAGVETQRQVVKEEKRRGVDNQPYGSLFEKSGQARLQRHALRLGADRLRPIHRPGDDRGVPRLLQNLLLPNNATLAVAGDFDLEATKKLDRRLLRRDPARRGDQAARGRVCRPQTAPQ